ncbi:MAG: hypothetical protein AB7G37_00725 [Solirubrobacteraceae bacterium]
MTLVLDAGALMRIERGDPLLARLVSRERRATRRPRTHGGVVGQVWRGGARQARLAHAMRGIEVVPLDEDLGRRAGTLLARSTTNDVIDAAVALIAGDGDDILTSDPDDLLPLLLLTGTEARVVAI